MKVTLQITIKKFVDSKTTEKLEKIMVYVTCELIHVQYTKGIYGGVSMKLLHVKLSHWLKSWNRVNPVHVRVNVY